MPIPSNSNSFWLLALGGTGRGAQQAFDAITALDEHCVNSFATIVDTDRAGYNRADSFLSLQLTPSDIRAIRIDPELYGPVAQLVVREYPELLDKDAANSGSRTKRVLTMLACAFHFDRIIRHFKGCCRDIVRSSGRTTIQPILFASSGGGAGSALFCVLGKLFGDQKFLSLVTEAFHLDLIASPIAVLAEPYAHALSHSNKHADRILSNAMATRMESIAIESNFRLILHQGLANEGGAMLDSQEAIYRNLGGQVYALARSWDFIKSRFVDTLDHSRSDDRFIGRNIPEATLPLSDHPTYASKLQKRDLYEQISLSIFPIDDNHRPSNEDSTNNE